MIADKTIRVEAKIPNKWVKKMQKYADRHYNGNRGLAVKDAVIKFAKEV